MSVIDYKNLGSAEEFQRLCADLLEAEGAINPRGHGRGPDQGSDFLIDIPESSLLGVRLRTYLVQCKWWAPNKSVGQAVISEGITSIGVHKAQGVMFIASCGYSGTAVTKVNAHNDAASDPRAAVLWTASELTRKLWKHPKILARYFAPDVQPHESGASSWQSSPSPCALGIPPAYQDIDLADLNFGKDESALVGNLHHAVRRLLRKELAIVEIRGGVGSGKTTVGCGIAADFLKAGWNCGYCASYDYKEKLFVASHNEDLGIFEWMNELKKFDLLIIDDFGHYLKDENETQKFAVRCLNDVVESRIQLQRPTILSVFWENKLFGPACHEILEQLEPRACVLDMGRIDRRTTNSPGPTYHDPGGRYLGRSWLLEKYHHIHSEVKYLGELCLVPDEEFDGRQRLLFDLDGINPTSKQQTVASKIKAILGSIERYAAFIEELKFNSIFFSEDGSISILRPCVSEDGEPNTDDGHLE
jgi:hypothetical protein